MKNFFRITQKKPKNEENKNVTLVVTGVSSENSKKELEKQLNDKGVKAVVTDSPVLGVFDL